MTAAEPSGPSSAASPAPPPHPSEPGRRRPASGAMTGLALGDALGFPTEFNTVPSILAKCGPWREMELPRPAFITDDTQMTLAVARGLRTAMAGGPLTAETFHGPLREEFVAWRRSPDNNRAPGGTCLAACEKLSHSDLRWQDASRTGSKGCGANMRVAPVGLVPGLTDGQRAGAAQFQAALTHGHPTGLAASDLTARAVRLLADGAAPRDLPGALRAYANEQRERYHEPWLGDLWRRSDAPSPERFIAKGWDECLAVLDRLDAALRAPDPEADPCDATGQGWIAEEALATGLLCFLLFPGEPLTALRRAACTAGDSDSLACLTGAFAGAHHGPAVWPEPWTDRLEHGTELAALGAAWDAGTEGAGSGARPS